MGRIIFLFFAGLTLAGLAADAWVSFSTNSLMTIPLGQVWYEFHAPSLNATQAGVQRYLSPAIWDPGIQTVLSAPSWILPLGITLGLLVLKRRK